MMNKCHNLCLITVIFCSGFIHGTSTTTQECMEAEPADIVLIIDGSGSVGSDGFKESLQFSNRLIDAFEIGPNETQVALIVFDSYARAIFQFNTYSDKQTLKAAINNTSFPGGLTNIPDGINKAVDMFSNPALSGKRIAVLLTDGESSDIQKSIDAANNLKNLGVTVYTAGVGSGPNEAELQQIASNKSYYFKVGDYNSLENISGPMASSACSDLEGCFCCNGGTCTPGNKCSCPAIYTGFYCETAICDQSPSPCVYGNCVVSEDTWHCTCHPGYNGTLCDKDIDECTSNPCVQGVCVDGVNSFECECTNGYNGTRCEEAICDQSPSPCVHGNCVVSEDTWHCTCHPGYNGTLCDKDIDKCTSNPCVKGVCVDGVNSFECECTSGYNGTRCEEDIDECTSNPCVQGVCVDGVNSFECECTNGYNGTRCEEDIDECTSNPCVQGVCVDGVNSFECDCTSGYNGTRCEEEIDECQSNPCQNGGTCNDSINSFSCQCAAGYTGSTCKRDINECESSPCENGGTCHDRVNAFSCDCPPKHYGFFCETGVCQPSVADIVFVLDSSVSQTQEEFKKQLDFVNHFIDHIIVGEKHFQVGVVTYSFRAVTEISLGKFNDTVTLKKAVANIQFKPGATFTDKGLEEAIKVFEEAPTHRPYGHTAKRFAFVLTDGLSTNRSSTAKAAKRLKSVVNKVLAIGVGNEVSHLELLTIASAENSDVGRKYVYSVQNFNALYIVVKELVHLSCEECYWSTSSDVLFLLDMSQTVSVDEFQTGLNAISYLVHRTSQMETENNTLRIGLVTYGKDIQLQRAFDDSETKHSFLSSIQKLEHQEGYCDAKGSQCGTKSLSDALRFTSQNIFNEIGNRTTETRELIVILSNGKQPITDELMAEIKHLQSVNKYFYVIALGEDANTEDLQKLVGDPALCYSVHSELPVKVLDALTTELFFSSCDLTNNFLDG